MTSIEMEQLSSTNVEEFVDFLRSVDGTFFAHTSREAAMRFLEASRDVFVLGRDAGRIIAFGMLRGWEDGFVVPSLGVAVSRDDVGKGYGNWMLGMLERLARERGAHAIRLRVHPANTRAQRLYEKRGYVVRGFDRGEIVMVLELDEPGR